jgi:hypothetical protein
MQQQQKEKGIPHMAIALRNKQMLALIIIAFLAVVTITFTVLAVAHIGIAPTFHILSWGFGSN